MKCLYVNPQIKTNSLVTLFSIPKPFTHLVGTIQQNAILSWTLLRPQVEIVLYGDEKGTAEIAARFDLIHVPQVKVNQYETPLLDSIFADINHRASGSIISYVNADIILDRDFLLAVNTVADSFRDFLVVGRRWNVEIKKKMRFDLEEQIPQRELLKKACLADCDCKDYFVFPKHLFAKIPAFAVGRGYWDTWMVRKAIETGYPTIDASLAIAAIHQNHPYTHIRGGKNEAYLGKEATINKTLGIENLGNVDLVGNIANANWQLKPHSYQNKPRFSIAIDLRTYSPLLEKVVLSVSIQEYRDYELIIITSDPHVREKLCSHSNKIKFLPSTNKGIVTVSRFAKGEFILFLDQNSLLVPRVLEKLSQYFAAEASTLDILVSGFKTIRQQVIEEKQPWQSLPSFTRINPDRLSIMKQHLTECLFVFRRCRLELLNDKDEILDDPLTLPNIMYRLIIFKGCRAKWFKSTAKVNSTRFSAVILANS